MCANYRTQGGLLLSESNETPTRPACILSRRALVRHTAQEVTCVDASLSSYRPRACFVCETKATGHIHSVNGFQYVKWDR